MATARGFSAPVQSGAQTAAGTETIAETARLLTDLCGARGCLVVLHGGCGDGAVWAACGAAPQILSAPEIVELTAHWTANGSPPARLTPSEIAVMRALGIELTDSDPVAIYRRACDRSDVTVVLVRPAREQAAAVEISLTLAGALISDREHCEQASFWRAQASYLRDSLAAARSQAARAARRQSAEGAALRRLIAKAESGDTIGLAAEFRRLARCDAFILAVAESGALRFAAASGVPSGALSTPGAEFRRALGRRAMIERDLARAPRLSRNEKLLRGLGYRASLCLPIDGGRLMLLARKPLTIAARAQLGRCGAAVAPYLKSAAASRELEHQRALVRTVVRGLFAAADAERAMMRRDLHDDWAQLLAAAQIAIRGDRAAARRFFRRLEDELRRRLDALRPPAPQAGMRSALDAQVRRLRAAGIRTSVSVRGVRLMPALVREVALRVIGEGVSNVIRHAAADRVRIELECRGGAAMVAVIDNGAGGKSGIAAGWGLRGLSERVAMLGGSCEIAAEKNGGTRLRALIPVADL